MSDTAEVLNAVLERLKAIEDRLTTPEPTAELETIYTYGPCRRCGYGPWKSYHAKPPRSCSNCKSAYWDREPGIKGRRPGDTPNPNWPWRGGRQRGPRTAPRWKHRPSETAPLPTMPDMPDPMPGIIPGIIPNGFDDVPEIPPPPRPEDVGLSLSEQLRERRIDAIVEPGVAELADAPSGERLSQEDADREGEGSLMANSPSNAGSSPAPRTNLHVAPMPDAIVEQILAGGEPGYDEIKQARESTGSVDARNEPAPEPRDEHPDPPAIAAKKAAFFAGFEIPEEPPDAPTTPFVTPSDAEAEEQRRKDDPFWK